jgi:hypothetical protein
MEPPIHADDKLKTHHGTDLSLSRFPGDSGIPLSALSRFPVLFIGCIGGQSG